MRGNISAWDHTRGVGTLEPDEIGAKGALVVSTALFLESGLQEPALGNRYDFVVRTTASGRVEPHAFKPAPASEAAGGAGNVRTGYISWWNLERCFGFIRPDGTCSQSTDVFCHIGTFTNSGLPLPDPLDRFRFKTKINARTGKPEAYALEAVR